MEILFVAYPKCTTCQKAKKWLDEQNVTVTTRHIVEDNPTAAELKTWLGKSGLPLKRFFNTSGIKYRALNLGEKLPTMTQEEGLDLLATDGMLVKRPLLITEKTVLPGFHEDKWRIALGLS